MKKVLLSIALFVSAIFTVNAQTADEVIAKYITEIGGAEKWAKVQSIKIEGQIEVQGIQIPFTMQGSQMKGMRVDAEFQGNKIIDITTPTKGWSQNPLSGKATLSPISEDELKQKLDDLDIQDAFVDYKAKGSVIESLGKDEEDGNDVFFEFQFTIDPLTKSLVLRVIDFCEEDELKESKHLWDTQIQDLKRLLGA